MRTMKSKPIKYSAKIGKEMFEKVESIEREDQ